MPGNGLMSVRVVPYKILAYPTSTLITIYDFSLGVR